MRNFIFYASVSYMIIVLSLIGINYFNRTTEIYFKPYEDYETQIKILENRTSTIANNECKSKVKELISLSKNTYFKDNVKIKDIYVKLDNNNMPWLSLYSRTIKACNLTYDKSSKDSMSVSLYNQNIINEYSFVYVVSFRDLEYADFYKGTLIPYENNYRKDAEVRVINSILNEVN